MTTETPHARTLAAIEPFCAGMEWMEGHSKLERISDETRVASDDFTHPIEFRHVRALAALHADITAGKLRVIEAEGGEPEIVKRARSVIGNAHGWFTPREIVDAYEAGLAAAPTPAAGEAYARLAEVAAKLDAVYNDPHQASGIRNFCGTCAEELREVMSTPAAGEALAPQEREPAWQRINALFERYGLPAPPTRLRDELVGHLVASDRQGGYQP